MEALNAEEFDIRTVTSADAGEFNSLQSFLDATPRGLGLIYRHAAITKSCELEPNIDDLIQTYEASPSSVIILRTAEKFLLVDKRNKDVQDIKSKVLTWHNKFASPGARPSCVVCDEPCKEFACPSCLASTCIPCFAKITRAGLRKKNGDLRFTCPSCRDTQRSTACFGRMQLEYVARPEFLDAYAAVADALSELTAAAEKDVGCIVVACFRNSIRVYSFNVHFDASGRVVFETKHLPQIRRALDTVETMFGVGTIPCKCDKCGGDCKHDHAAAVRHVGRGFEVQASGAVSEVKHGFHAMLGCFYSA